jgi:DNA-directed RNA polymerase subunit RPC12/RpoP
MLLDLVSALAIIVAIGFIVLFFVLPRWGPHYTSRLTCPNCKKTFNFHWIPGATISSILNRNYRKLKCPYCHIQSNYEIASTRVRTAKPNKKRPKQA